MKSTRSPTLTRARQCGQRDATACRPTGGRREGAGRPKGAKGQRTVAVEQAMRVVAEKLKQAVPDAFEGDGVAYMQSVYRDPSFSEELRLDAAAKAARFERPTLAAVAVQQQPRARVDLSALSPEERETLGKLLRRTMGMATTGAIDGRVES
jgi:hypothetical protein